MNECTHENKEPRKRKNGIWIQCLDCWQSVGSAIKKLNFTPAQIAAMPEFNDAAKEGYSDLVYKARQNFFAEQSAERRAFYETYIVSPEWFAKRDLILRRDNYLCQGCLLNKAEHVHHLTYIHLGDEFAFELISVCVPCHERIHGKPICRK